MGRSYARPRVYLRTAWASTPTTGRLRLREDARLSWASSRARGPGTADPFGDISEPRGRVPGEIRDLRRIIGPGTRSPPQFRAETHLGLTRAQPYDLRKLFQINVEEGRHLGRCLPVASALATAGWGGGAGAKAEALLERRSGNAENPRLFGAFNEPTHDWLAVLHGNALPDRDGNSR